MSGSLVQADRALRAIEELQRVRQRFPNTPESAEALNLLSTLYRLYVRAPAQPAFVFSGRAIGEASRLKDVIGLEIDPKSPVIGRLLDEIKSREHEGYTYDGADGSFELLARRLMHGIADHFRLLSFRVISERRFNARGELVTMSEATVKLDVGGELVERGAHQAVARALREPDLDLRLGRPVAALALAHRLRRPRVLARGPHRRPRVLQGGSSPVARDIQASVRVPSKAKNVGFQCLCERLEWPKVPRPRPSGSISWRGCDSGRRAGRDS